MSNMKLSVFREPASGPFDLISVMATFSSQITEDLQIAILERVVDKIAERYVEENYAELVAKLDQQAIANLAIADSGKKIAEEIRTRPTVIREPGNKTSITKFSIF